MSKIVVRYWAAARSAAEIDQETFEADTAGAALASAKQAHPALATVLEVATLLVDGRRADIDTALADGSTVEVLPPFAGG
ncbi:MoaD/ThiS family protein [Leekyejoonella antrihumi]|uniref:MoaD/ThiS family protein n=1 Tax=Leekyejoonella antrihumi TaxID=1660198 RepID=A0A563EAS6_9MICO|nr:MoaD/ThiS family protein [Leekyejoonella antrihumi]TWP38894.1 MoaD/ThiS family protein [Leekyejoonella antrihumi]